MVGGYGSNDLNIPNTIANQYTSGTINVAQGTTPITLVTGTPGYYTTTCGVTVDPTCSVSGGGEVNITLTDSSSGVISVFRFYIPAASSTPTVPTFIKDSNSPGFFWNNKVAGSSLAVASSVALTTGSIRCFLRYGLCSYLG